MNLLKKLLGLNTPPPAPPPVAPASAGLPRPGDVLPASLQAHSQFIKRINCPRCGAPKTLPSTTAYLYCDYCGSLMDYDFRLANANTNAALSNTVFHRRSTARARASRLPAAAFVSAASHSPRSASSISAKRRSVPRCSDRGNAAARTRAIRSLPRSRRLPPRS